MRGSTALLAMLLMLSGCSGFDKFLDDTVTLPGANPDEPKGNSENMMKVRGEMVSSTPILPQGDNIWPSRPPALPTLSDVANDEKSFSLSDYSHAYGADQDVVDHEQGKSLTLPSDFPEDGDISEGEKALIKKGVNITTSDKNMNILPDHIDDRAPNYIEKDKHTSPITVPNGDGTSTVISPSGVVSIVKDSNLSKGSTQKKEKKQPDTN